jgi:hypothetical protein
MRRTLTFTGWTIVALVIAASFLFWFTDVWPFMHEVMIQQSWKPVCPGPNGAVVFCR